MSRADLFSLSIQHQDFNVGEEYVRLVEETKHFGYNQSVGAVVFFVGTVRTQTPSESMDNADITVLELEYYPGMTEQVLQDIIKQATARWVLQAARIVHRVGKLHAGEQIVFVATASEHREQAFQAAEFLMDFLKTQAPIWKKEISAKGEHWVEAKEKDIQSKERWQ
jgi:molybdopterin synthase catalytic subunit